ncbi:glycosyltransferase family 2 protein [Salinibacter altiplanensis]|uniref:glycosyltransferase family 2 protein n=1 Tax=Salinibacter altiplanensis TaxID=1803181 RepID=UPI000C9F347B|nr:glycosyltransferase family 2 protein [Salinibacter altiplanensis]
MIMHVSIIINNHNYEKYIVEAIKSALNQTHKNREVIVVDDGSTDSSRDLIKNYKKEVSAVYKENGGQASALNAGFEASSGDLILFLDADDYLQPEAVETAASMWETGVAKVQYRLQCIDENGNPLDDFVKPRWEKSLPSGYVKEQIRERGDYVTSPTSGNLFSRDALEDIFPIPPKEWRICADAYMYLKAPFYGSVRSLNCTLGHYRIHGENAWQTGGAEPEMLSRRVRVHLQKQELIAKLLGRDFEFPLFTNMNFARDRMVSLVLRPDDHPLSDDDRISAMWYGLRSAYNSDYASCRRRIKQSMGYIGLGAMPRVVAKHILDRYFN